MYTRVLIGCVNYTMDARTTVRNYAVNPPLCDPFYDSPASLSLFSFFDLISFLRYRCFFFLLCFIRTYTWMDTFCTSFSPFLFFFIYPLSLVLFFFIFSKRFHFIHAFYNILSTALYIFSFIQENLSFIGCIVSQLGVITFSFFKILFSSNFSISLLIFPLALSSLRE